MFQRDSSRRLLAGLIFLCLCACSPTPAPLEAPPADTPAPATGLQASVNRALEAHGLIALGAVVASEEGVLEIAVAGTRANNSDAPALVSDAWHLGSNTKALTALLYAQLVERDLAQWGATLPDLFPDLADEMDPAWQTVTIEDLFAHRSGLKQLRGGWLNARRNDERPLAEQRAATARDVLTEPPIKTPGTYDYNNLNYILAGAAMESILASQADLPASWESAMQVLVFDRLENESLRNGFGFGAPPEGLQGHRGILGAFISPVGRGPSADNPGALGPAGTLHATLGSHAALATEFLKDESDIVPVAVREKLFSAHPDASSDYAMGWGIVDDPTYGRLYMHSGSNTMWTSRIIIAPDLDRVIIVNTNQYSDAAQDAIRAVCVEALDQAVADQRPE